MTHSEIEGYQELEELALDLIWSWNRSADAIWRALDEPLFEATHNPWVVLQTVSREKLKALLQDLSFRKKISTLLETHVRHFSQTWFQQKYGKEKIQSIAYFSMEFMLSEALPIYSGGLGNVAGDQLKAASDLGVPVIGIGLLYQQGYFRQIIDASGSQQAAYPFNSPLQLPIQPLRQKNGEWLRLEIVLPGWSLWLRAWEVKVGRVKLYLLDSNDIANYPVYRGITSELYGGDLEMRLRQELVLGIGGVRLLQELGIYPDVCHLNEGHAAFAVLERIKLCMQKQKVPFEEAFYIVRASHIFTTHTAVPAGFDRFPNHLIETYLGCYVQNGLHIPIAQLLDLGKDEQSEGWFNMAHFAIRASGAINAVSKLHGYVSRRLFSSLFTRYPIDEIPIGYVTNGIHTPSWISAHAKQLWSQYIDETHTTSNVKKIEASVPKISDAEIWQMRNDARAEMVAYARKSIFPILAARGCSLEQVEEAKHYFDPHVLTLGFARRFASYKRPNMLLFNQERLMRILTHPERPVQLLVAGKAHPADKPGQEMIRQWIDFIQKSNVRSRILFLSDYDMFMAKKLVEGVDVWLNTPRRPWEACGTSGMKVLVNGGLNLSELDGWWAEAYSPEVGWALGDGQEHGDDAAWDAKEALQLYDLLEQQIIPEFYQRDFEKNIPKAWIARIRASMFKLTPLFSADRSVREYVENYYVPAAAKYQKRLQNNAALGKNLYACQLAWKEFSLSSPFQKISFSSRENDYEVTVRLNLKTLDSSLVQIEIYADGNPSFRKQMRPEKREGSFYEYQAFVPNSRPTSHYTVRILPCFADANVALELPYILWAK